MPRFARNDKRKGGRNNGRGRVGGSGGEHMIVRAYVRVTAPRGSLFSVDKILQAGAPEASLLDAEDGAQGSVG